MTDPAAAYYISGSLKATDDTVADCAAFQTLMGTATRATTQAKGRWQDYRVAEGAAPFYHLVCTQGTDSPNGIRGARHEIEIELYACWPVEKQAGDTEKGWFLRAANAWGQFLSQLNDVIGTSNSSEYLITADRDYQPPALTDDKGPNPGCWDATIVFRVRV